MGGKVTALMTKERERMERILEVRATYRAGMCKHSLVLVDDENTKLTASRTVISSFIDAFAVPLDMGLVVVWRAHLHGMSECRPPPRQRRLELLLEKTVRSVESSR